MKNNRFGRWLIFTIIALIAVLVFSGYALSSSLNITSGEAKNSGITASADMTVTAGGTISYDEGQKILAAVNQIREKEGLSPLKADADLTSAAAQRGAEASLSFSTTRPDGTDFSTVSDKSSFELLALGTGSADAVVSAWLQDSDALRKILDPDAVSAGAVCYNGGTNTWVLEIGKTSADALTSEQQGEADASVEINVKSSDVSLSFVDHADGKLSLSTGSSESLTAAVKSGDALTALDSKSIEWSSDNEAVASVSDGTVTANQAGTAKITAAVGSQTVSLDVTVTDNSAQDAAVETQSASPKVSYSAHVQNIGWQDEVSDGSTAGTTGQSLRMEGLKIQVEGLDGGIEYRSHLAGTGWESTWKSNGEVSGTTGQSRRIEAVEIRLTGAAASQYDVYYRVHVRDGGWLAWASNGEPAGTESFSLRAEAIQIKLVPKGTAIDAQSADSQAYYKLSVDYNAHVQNIGWQDEVSNGSTAGTTGKALRMEAFTANVQDGIYNGGISYQAYVQNKGWLDMTSNGSIAGTTGQALRLEAVKLSLTGNLANKYDIYYRVHVQNFGWTGWACNGQAAGSADYSYRAEAIQVVIRRKGSGAPGSTANTFNVKPKETAIPNFDFICAVVQQEGGSSYDGALAVISCIRNRVDSGRWGGSDIVSVITARGQFSAYSSGAYRKYLGKSSAEVQQAVRDCILLNKRSHPYQSFRSYRVAGAVYIANQWYF